ncbi:MAG TPA: hypothetical protein VK982_06285 [Bacteroidales bacterium]|nr:hypothetical protein [Bacteroidales bacterium]
MKKIITLIAIIATITFISCEDDPDTPADFTASQGTYIGAVHLAYGELDGQAIVCRFNEDNANWDEISWTWSSNFDDIGYLLPDHYIVPGKEYRYKMRVYEEGQGDGYSGYTNEITGYAFKGDPAEITSINRESNGDKVDITISWTNPNDLSEIKNLNYITYQVYRAENGNLSDYKYAGKQEQMVTQPSDIKYEWSYSDTWLDPAKTYSYKIETRYRYQRNTSDGSYSDDQYYEVDGITVDENYSGNDDNPIVTYTTTDLGQLIAAASGDIIVEIKEKVVNGDVYLGVITGNTVEATPSLFKYNGSVFENVWTCDDLGSSVGIHYAITSSGESYVAGSGDSLCIYKREGSSWSQDIAPDNIGLIGLEVCNDELYLFAEFNDLHQVMKYNGSSWSKVGETIASGSIYDVNIETVDGNLYVHYTIDNTLYIKHLSGGSWVSDLEWTQEWLSNIQLAKNGDDLYFSTSTNSQSNYDGGVYRVTGSTSVENLIPDGAADSWFVQGAFTMSVDTEGNLIVSSIKGEKISETEVIVYPYLILYDGSQWNTISGDFTDGFAPIGVSTTGSDIFYFYGEEATLNSSHQSTVLKTKKLTK